MVWNYGMNTSICFLSVHHQADWALQHCLLLMALAHPRMSLLGQQSIILAYVELRLRAMFFLFRGVQLFYL